MKVNAKNMFAPEEQPLSFSQIKEQEGVYRLFVENGHRFVVLRNTRVDHVVVIHFIAAERRAIAAHPSAWNGAFFTKLENAVVNLSITE